MEQKVVVCDTNIFIEFYKGNNEIIENLKNIGYENIAISSVTAGELIFGAINKNELKIIKKNIEQLKILPINNEISFNFISLMEKYSLNHNLDLPDALIASTAMFYNIELFTLNTKHFKYIDNLKLYK